jgi:sulfur-oxidizing protein SoxZ
VEVFRADLFPAISANPFISFFTLAAESGVIALNWTADTGETHTETATIAVD